VRVDATENTDDAYTMGYADGHGDLSKDVRQFLDDLIGDEAFRGLPPDLRERARQLVQKEPDPYA
jgi:hypothetical protein